MIRPALASLAIAALLAGAPAAASAQSPGSQAYQDPLAGDAGSGSGGGGGGGSTRPSSSGTEAAQNGSRHATAPLPRTGLDGWLLALAGATLLGSGVVLRRATRRVAH